MKVNNYYVYTYFDKHSLNILTNYGKVHIILL